MACYQFAAFIFDADTGQLLHQTPSGQTETYLRHKVSQLLTYLLTHPDQVLSKDTLLEALWDHSEYRENSLTQSIRELRKALGDSAQNPQFIRTFPQRGYQWICPVLAPEPQEPATQPPAQAPAEKQAPTPVAPDRRLSRPLVLSGLLAALLLVAGFWLVRNPGPLPAPDAQQETARHSTGLVVFPMLNDTGKAEFDWVQLGLADMLSVKLNQSSTLTVIPPALAKAWLLDAELSWPALPAQIRTLLRQRDYEAALFASVRLHNKQQVLTFQVIYADGRTQQGSMTYPQLAAAMHSVSHQLQRLLQPGQPQVEPQSSPAIAVQTLAQGRSLLQTQGAQAARKYFEAAHILEPENLWTQIQLAGTEVLLGQWQQATHRLQSLPDAQIQKDPALSAAQHYWLGELSYRRGEPNAAALTAEAVRAAMQANASPLLIQAYQLQAQMAWNEMDWEGHQRLTKQLIALLGTGQALRQDADQQFYLGRPASVGLERSPGNDLAANQVRLFKALNFYRQLGDQPRQAATLLAIAQNDQVEPPIRESSLSDAIALYRELDQPYELALALIYQGFYLMQTHQGDAAEGYFAEARTLAEQLGAQRLFLDSEFYLAFAAMDQGLDLQWLGKHPQQPQHLERADQAFTALRNKEGVSLLLKANIALFQGWIATDQHQTTLAMQHLDRAGRMAEDLNLPLTQSYVRYSKMRIHLEQGDYAAALAAGSIRPITRLEAIYKTRAQYELGHPEQALTTLAQFQADFPEQWLPEDSQRQQQYQLALAGNSVALPAEPKAHLVYCESSWL
ncbi:winged helix-turn-helix domain-containing protein [Photobacterium sp. TLY01]|uniref:winged helix-turn-helix domain-containing protein n=1 Tax=Photobacterium sp. TLY01 TaxID=2907534 RepID=UPI001F41B6D7|nr:winged helix-turn-helix domain-containing protein [Photobacterium sp. TLY01]UIP27598.1 winged helix-turn-helix domain-containing protein [Photobacterium sp. TLY01]